MEHAAVDTGSAEVIDLVPDEAEWRFPDSVADGVASTEPRTIRLPQGSQGAFTVAGNAHCRRIAVTRSRGSLRPRAAETTLYLYDLDTGEALGHAATADFCVILALHDDGSRVLVNRKENRVFNSNQVEVWTLTPDGIHRKHSWSVGDAGRNAGIIWCALLHENQVATRHSDQSLLIWDFETGMGRFVVELDRCQPVVSPNGRWLAFLANKTVCVWDAAEESLVATIPVDYFTVHLSLAFDASGRQLAFQAGDDLFLWDLASDESMQQMKLSGVNPTQLTAVLSENYLFFSRDRRGVVFDTGIQTPLWGYSFHDVQPCGEEFCFLAQAGNENALTIAALPDPLTQAGIDRATSDPELLLIHRGASAAIDVSGLAPQHQAPVREVIAQKLAALGVTVSADAQARFVARESTREPRTIWIEDRRNQRMGLPLPFIHGARTENGFERTITESVTSLSVVFQDQSAWSSGRVSRPSSRIRLSPNESIDAALIRLTAPDYGFFDSVEIPQNIIRPTDGQRVAGSSTITLEGVQTDAHSD